MTWKRSHILALRDGLYLAIRRLKGNEVRVLKSEEKIGCPVNHVRGKNTRERGNWTCFVSSS